MRRPMMVPPYCFRSICIRLNYGERGGSTWGCVGDAKLSIQISKTFRHISDCVESLRHIYTDECQFYTRWRNSS